jgi:hypothetical protein
MSATWGPETALSRSECAFPTNRLQPQRLLAPFPAGVQLPKLPMTGGQPCATPRFPIENVTPTK